MENKYPEYIMQDLRERRGLDKKDTCKDESINKMSNDKVLYELFNWNGLLGNWSTTVKKWVEDIYSVKLE